MSGDRTDGTDDHSDSVGSRRLVLVLMCVGYFLVLLDVTVVNVALPAIGTDLGSGVAGLQWVVDGYALALAALLLASGTIGDLRGHKRVVLIGLSTFGLASLGCALAPSTGALIAARAVQGVGAALLLPGTLAIISAAHPEPGARARAIGIWAGVGSVALPAGPLIGGVLIESLSWRWVFAINVPIVVVASLLALRRVRSDSAAGTDVNRRIDLAGTIMAAVALASITVTVIEWGHGGIDSVVIGSAVISALAVIIFVVVERRQADPMLPLELFRSRAFSTANGIAGLMNLGTLGLLFLLTQFLQTVQGRTALLAGVAVLPLFLPLSLLAPLAGRVVGRHGAKPVMITGLLVGALGVALLTVWTPTAGYLRLLPAMLGWGIGLGILTPALVAAAIAAAPAGRSGLASGINNTARQAGGAIGIAAFGAVAGSPRDPHTFTSALQLLGLVTAGLWAAAALTAVIFVPGRPSARR